MLAQGRTVVNGPHQGALVDTANGEWWFVHFQDADVYGRILHLQPVHWHDGWSLMGEHGEPVSHHAKPRAATAQKISEPATSDEFSSPELGLQWQWQANHANSWHSLTACPGWLRLFPQFVGDGDLTKAPNLLLQKFPAQSFVAETILEFTSEKSGVEAGLVIAGKTCAALALRRAGNINQIVFRHGEKDEVLREISGGRITLRVTVADGGLCDFSFAELNDFVSVPIRFQATAGVWIGAKTGIYTLKRDSENSAGHADFKCFRFRPATAA